MDAQFLQTSYVNLDQSAHMHNDVILCRSQAHSIAQKFFARWHVAYCCIPTSHVKDVIKTGQFIHADWTGEMKLSPD